MSSGTDTTANPYTPVMLSVFRMVIGVLFALHGSSKLFGWPGSPSMDAFSWPFWWAGIVEVIVGVLVAIGFYTRAAAFIGAGQMAVAYFWQHFPDDFWPINNKGEPAVLFCFSLLLLVFAGPGSLALSRK